MSAATERRERVAVQRVEAVLCSRRRWSGERRCSRPATVRLVGVCVHEHLTRETPYCDIHAERDAKAGHLACTPCHEGPEPHTCLVRTIDEVRL